MSIIIELLNLVRFTRLAELTYLLTVPSLFFFFQVVIRQQNQVRARRHFAAVARAGTPRAQRQPPDRRASVRVCLATEIEKTVSLCAY